MRGGRLRPGGIFAEIHTIQTIGAGDQRFGCIPLVFIVDFRIPAPAIEARGKQGFRCVIFVSDLRI
jgi:hypothetical protein